MLMIFFKLFPNLTVASLIIILISINFTISPFCGKREEKVVQNWNFALPFVVHEVFGDPIFYCQVIPSVEYFI